jgi:hypothetical protein
MISKKYIDVNHQCISRFIQKNDTNNSINHGWSHLSYMFTEAAVNANDV